MSAPVVAGGLAWEALDSRGRPTVGCELRLESGATGAATVPSGASTGRYEATELRDGGERFGGLGVQRAVENLNNILLPAIAGRRFENQHELDAALVEADGSPNLSHVGANAVLALSVAWALANARSRGLELYQIAPKGTPPLLPLPMVNILSGGAHAAGALDLQDVLVIPLAARRFSDAIEHVSRVRAAAVRLATRSGLRTDLVADEGGLGLRLGSNRRALELVTDAIEAAGFDPGVDVAIAIDVAANQLESGGGYRLGLEDRQLTSAGLIDEINRWRVEFPILSIEDPLGDRDWAGWEAATGVWQASSWSVMTCLPRTSNGSEPGASGASRTRCWSSPTRPGRFRELKTSRDPLRRRGTASSSRLAPVIPKTPGLPTSRSPGAPDKSRLVR